MSRGLEALHHPRIELANIDISVEGKKDIAHMPFYKTKQYTAIEKELNALKIIKEKDVDIIALKISIDLKQYNCKEDGRCPLTQEEYVLLKEVLL